MFSLISKLVFIIGIIQYYIINRYAILFIINTISSMIVVATCVQNIEF